MKGMLSEILIFTILLMAFIVGYAGFYGALAGNSAYGFGGNNSSMSNLASSVKIEQMKNKTYIIESTFQNASNINNTASQGIAYMFYAPYQFIVGAVQAGLLVFDVPDMIHAMITDMTTFLGIPEWIMSVVYTIILITIVFAIFFFIRSGGK